MTSSVEKARANFGRRKHTTVVLAEEPVAVAREQVVAVVAQAPRQDSGGEEDFPEAAEVGRDLQRRVRARVDALAAPSPFDEDDRVHAAQLRVALDDRPPVVALERGEAHLAAAVVVEYQLHRLVAEAAHAVIEQDGCADGSFYHEFDRQQKLGSLTFVPSVNPFV